MKLGNDNIKLSRLQISGCINNMEISGVMLVPISATSTSLTFGCGPLNYVSTFPSNYPKMYHGRT